MKIHDTVDVCLLSIGSIYSLANIEQILGIIILFIQIAWLCVKIGCKIYNKITHKSSEEVTKEEIKNIDILVDKLVDEYSQFKEEADGYDKQ